MAATSFTTLPSSSYIGLGSQGDLLHSANYGTYDTGIGSITANSYQYQPSNFNTHLTDNQQQSSYSNDYLQSTYSNGGYSTQQPQYSSTDRYAQQSIYDQDPLNNYTNSQTQKYNDRSTISNNIDGNYTTANTTQQLYKTPMDNQHVESTNQYQTSYGGTTQHYPPTSTNNQHHQLQVSSQSNPIQSEHNNPSHPPSKQQQQRHQSQPTSQSNPVRSENQISNHPPKQSQPIRHRSPSNGGNGYATETTTKTNNPPAEMKTTKSSQMRAAAIKQKGEVHEKKQKDGNFPSSKKKSTPPKSHNSQPQSIQQPSHDDERYNKEKSKRNKKQSHSVPKQRKSRRDDEQTEDNNTSADEDNHHNRNKSKKRAAFSDPHNKRYPQLPPIRRGQGPPYYDPMYDYSFPPGHPLRGRHPYYDDYLMYGPYPGRHDPRHRHLYEDAYDVPPYIASYHDPYDGFFDYEKRKVKSKSKISKDKKEATTDHEDHGGLTGNETEQEDDMKSQQSKKSKNHKNINKDDDNENEENTHKKWPHNYYEPPYYDGGDMLELWRQERNDYLKKKFKPTIHDVLYSQQWMKSDSYLENQRRRTLRDTQGYYFPYKKYTLKDYKDLQKMESQHNPYASINENTLDRKERARKRQEYASQIERQAGDISGGQHKTPRDTQLRKPWHLSGGETNDPEKASKRDRALEYAKVQVVKHRPHKAPKNRSDPTERYVNSLFPQTNDDDDDGSGNGRHSRNNQSGDDEDQ